MSRKNTPVPSARWVSSLTILCLAGCSGSVTPAAGTVGTQAPAQSTQAVDLAAKEAELAQREAELALKEREQAVARREAELAAREAAAPKAAKAPKAKPVVAKASPTPPPPPQARLQEAAPAVPSAPLPQPLPIILPAGTQFEAALIAEVSTKTARLGDPVTARVSQDVLAEGRRAIPAGTRIHGTVTEVVSGSHKVGGVPTLGLRFDGLELQSGKVVGIHSTLMQQGKSDTGRDTAKIAGGALAGAILGKQMGDNKGRLIGGLLGGAAGVAAAKNTGTEVILAAGTPLTVTLDAPLPVSGN